LLFFFLEPRSFAVVEPHLQCFSPKRGLLFFPSTRVSVCRIPSSTNPRCRLSGFFSFPLYCSFFPPFLRSDMKPVFAGSFNRSNKETAFSFIVGGCPVYVPSPFPEKVFSMSVGLEFCLTLPLTPPVTPGPKDFLPPSPFPFPFSRWTVLLWRRYYF